VWLKLELNV